jgi:anti-anti-sigma factor
VLTESPLVVVVSLQGEFDRGRRADELFAAAAAFDPSEIRLECDTVEFCDSTFVRALLHLLYDVCSHGGQVTIVRPSSPVRRLLEVAGVAELFEMER